MLYQNWEKGEKVAEEVGEKVFLLINKLVLFKYIYTLILLCTFYFPMGESINAFISFLTDKTHKLSAKAIVVIGVVLSVLFIDNVFGFTFYYQNEKKLSQIEQINRILSNEGDNESKYRHYLLKLKEDIVQRRSLQNKTFDFLTSLDFSTINNQSEIAQESVKVSTFWHFISSSWVFVLLMLIIPFTAFSDKKHSIWYNIVVLILLELFLFLVGLGLSKITSYIPIFFADKVWINYFMNISLVTIVFIVPPLIYAWKERNSSISQV